MTKIDKAPNNSIEQKKSHNIYVFMACVSSNADIPSRYFRDSSQPTNWILDSGATSHMTPDIWDFITGSMLETDKYIEFEDGHFVTL